MTLIYPAAAGEQAGKASCCLKFGQQKSRVARPAYCPTVRAVEILQNLKSEFHDTRKICF